MTSTPLLQDAFAHNAWATEVLIDACLPLTGEQLTTELPGTYGPIVAILHHMVFSDRWYLSFFRDDVEVIEDDARFGLPELRSIMTGDLALWQEVIAGDPDPDRQIREIDGEWEIHAPVGVRLAQVVHHGTDHRSQICTILTTLGIEPPQIDVWAYARATGRERSERLSCTAGD